MKRHVAFQDLSRDHYVVLNRSLQVVRTVEGHPAARPYEHAVVQLAALWHDDGLRDHFLEEEANLVPALRAHGDPGGLADRMLREHADLRAAFAKLDRTTPPAEAAALARALTAHVRWEENFAFNWLQDHLPADGLAALLGRSQAFRAAHGLPVNPPRP